MKITRPVPNVDWRDQDLGGKRPGKSVCVVRYGAIGDVIQASTLFPLLQEQGYYVCLNCKERGYFLVRKDPHLDEVFIQADDFVMNTDEHPDLRPYWKKLGANFDRFIQLSESVEGGLLATQHMQEYNWSRERRHAKFNVNYLERIHDIAELPHRFDARFYPSAAEKQWAAQTRRGLGDGNFIIMWSLAGSSVHKVWPYINIVVARLLQQLPTVRIVMVGDERCQLIERGWIQEQRVMRSSGRWSIRESLTFAEECDLVIGTETGLLNAVGLRDVHKICFLSHSSEENLTKHWKNTRSLTPQGTPCFPCHQMHPEGFKTCHQDDRTGMAKCAADISPEVVWDAILAVMQKQSRAMPAMPI